MLALFRRLRENTIKALLWLVAALILSGCGIAERQEAQHQKALRKQTNEQQNANARSWLVACDTTYPKDKRTRENMVQYALCVQNAMSRFPNENIDKDPLMIFSAKLMFISEKYRDGKISREDANHLANLAWSEARKQTEEKEMQLKIISVQESQLRVSKCLSARYNANSFDDRGLNSTNGAVAIISLLGAIGRASEVAQNCD